MLSSNVHVQMQTRELAADVAAGLCKPCEACNGLGQNGTRYSYQASMICTACDGFGFFGLEPEKPTKARPGSLLKVAIIARRYHLGLPLEIEGDVTARGDADEGTDSDSNAPGFMLPDNYAGNRPRTYAMAGGEDEE